MGGHWLALLWMGVALQATDAPGAADLVVMRDGQEVRGQVVGGYRPGQGVTIAVRREWARVHLPEKAVAWERAEQAWVDRARRERLDRLQAWRRERSAGGAEASDRLLQGIDAEIERMERGAATESPLMLVSVGATDVARVERKPDDLARMFRRGLRIGLPDVESMPVDRLRAALQDRGFAADSKDEASIAELLPVPRESNERWLARRAATEVLAEPALRYIQFGGLVLPESSEKANAEVALSGLIGNTLRQLLDDEPAGHPLEPIGRTVEGRGRVGLMVTELAMDGDLQGSNVTATLYVRVAPERWEPAWKRSAQGVAGQAGGGEELAVDPQVRAVFRLFDAIAPAGAGDAAKQASLGMGAAVRRALGEARDALQKDLESVALEMNLGP